MSLRLPYAKPGCQPSVRSPPARRREPDAALHVSRGARLRYRIEEALFTLEGDVVFADVGAARRLAELLTRVQGDGAVTPGRLFALGLVHELLHATVARYRREVDPAVFEAALGWLAERLGRERLEAALAAFAREFPPLPVWRGEVSPEEYLAGASAGRSHRERLLEEMLILWLVNSSPAFTPFRELFDDGELRRGSSYPEIVAGLEEYLSQRPAFGAAGVVEEEGRSLFEVLRAPIEADPTSPSGQLRFLYESWAHRPGPQAPRLLRARDLLAEEERPVFPPGPGPVEVADPAAAAAEGVAAFSPDVDWMPRLVLLAKNLPVWLHQLSRDHGRPVRRLDEIPGEELDRLARWGVNGLWLIGLWERSPASGRIKQLTGHPEAAGSAYSLYDYEIAADLGGDEALDDLARRARRRGIRLAADMVPNHMGIDSCWVREHPERFLSLPRPPFPSYRFSGPDLSSDPAVGLYLEDHYYDRTDAAVVFQRLDRATGEARYLYHGNDGTSTPWNDTAQLDYLQPEVREAVLETILRVVRRFPIVRFDAAMTLAKRHVRRLWYPPPGEGGTIPSRAEHGLAEEELDERMPEEFWRQVVDRVAAEAPGTLLLAEAFWLMEAYFVRTLGMHRVYNSAFMVLLRDERNADYRQAIQNVLAFEPQILQRYVNFMNNPDERTAVEQFGKGDKYFGVCTVMVTLPGLPMLGHGQVEGYAEKYGMEFLRPQRDERPDPWLVARHEAQIFPLLHRRRLFAGSARFFLYDFETAPGRVDENVFAYSNREPGSGGTAAGGPAAEGGPAEGAGGGRALVVFHNHPGATRGRIRRSVLYAGGETAGGKRRLVWTSLARGLGLEEPDLAGAAAGRRLVRCRDQATGLEHLFDLARVIRRGLELALGPYACHVFLDFQALADDAQGRWAALAASLDGRGVPSLEEALLEPALEPLLEPFRRLFVPDLLRRFRAAGIEAGGAEAGDLPAAVEELLVPFLDALAEHLAEPGVGAAKLDGQEPAASAAEGGSGGQEAAPGKPDGGEGTEAGAGPEAMAPPSGRATPAELAAAVRRDLAAALGLAAAARQAGAADPHRGIAQGAREGAGGEAIADEEEPAGPGPYLAAGLGDDPARWGTLYAWLVTRRLGELAAGDGETRERSRSWLDDLLLGKQILAALAALGLDREAAREALLFAKVLVGGSLPPLEAPLEAPSGAVGGMALDVAPAAGGEGAGGSPELPEGGASEAASPAGDRDSDPWRRWTGHPDVRLALRHHRFDGEVFFHQESCERLLFWGVFATALESGLASDVTARAHRAAGEIAAAAAAAGYRLDAFLAPELPVQGAQGLPGPPTP